MKKRLISILLFLVIVSVSVVPLYAVDEGAENLALGKTVWATDQYSDNYKIANVNDGNLNTAWASGGTLLSGLSGNYCYIAIDLGQTYNITSFVARSRRDINQGYNRTGWLVQFSNDVNFQTFEEVGRKLDAGEYKSDLELNFEQEPKAYRYVRVAHEMRGNMVISEIEVFGEPYFGEGKTEFSDTEGKLSDSANLLSILGIMGTMEKTKFMPNMVMSRIDALDTVLKAINYNFGEGKEAATAEDRILFAEKCGIISSASDFRPRDYVTVQEYKKMLLCAMGYDEKIKELGGWPAGIYEVSSSLGWNRATTQGESDLALRSSIANITYYALTSPVYNVGSFGNGYMEMYKGEMLLTKAFGLTLYKGIVTANNVTNLSEYSKKGNSFVEIDYKEYIDESASFSEYIGKRVFFLIDEAAQNRIVDGFLSATDNYSLEISMGNIRSYSGDEVTYFDEDENEEEISLADDCAFIKNGVAKANITEKEFKKANGTVVFTDTDGDDEIDVVYLNAPTIAVCDYCVDNGETVDFRGVDGTTVKADYESVSYFRNGRKVLSEQMTRNSLIYCYVSENKKVVRFECFTNKIEGIVNGYSSKFVNIDGTEYKVSEYFATNELSNIEVGTVGIFVFDEDMKIVAVVDAKDLYSGEFYGVILGYNKQGLAQGKLRLFTQENEFVILNTSENIKLDGAASSDVDLNTYVGELIIFKKNYAEEVTEIFTQHGTNPRIVESEIEVENAWCYGNAIYDSSNEKANMLFTIDKESIVFTLPYIDGELATGKEYEENYSADTFANAIKKGNNGQLGYYNVDNFLTPQVIVKKTSASNASVGLITSGSPDVYMIESIGEAYENDEFYTELEVINVLNGEKSKMLYHEDFDKILMYDKMLVQDLFRSGTLRIPATDLSDAGKAAIDTNSMSITDLKKGDIIRGQIDSGSTNKFSAVDRIYTPSDFEKSISYISYGESAPYANASFKLRCGTLTNILNGKLLMSVSSDGKYYTSIYGEAKNLIVYDGDISVHSARELPAYTNSESEIVILSGDGIDKAIFIYND